jgi:hypothetical protein
LRFDEFLSVLSSAPDDLGIRPTDRHLRIEVDKTFKILRLVEPSRNDRRNRSDYFSALSTALMSMEYGRILRAFSPGTTDGGGVSRPAHRF